MQQRLALSHIRPFAPIHQETRQQPERYACHLEDLEHRQGIFNSHQRTFDATDIVVVHPSRPCQLRGWNESLPLLLALAPLVEQEIHGNGPAHVSDLLSRGVYNSFALQLVHGFHSYT